MMYKPHAFYWERPTLRIKLTCHNADYRNTDYYSTDYYRADYYSADYGEV